MKYLIIVLALIPGLIFAESAIEIPEVVITGESVDVADSVKFETVMKDYWNTEFDKKFRYLYLPSVTIEDVVEHYSQLNWAVWGDFSYLPGASLKIASYYASEKLLAFSAGLKSRKLDSSGKFSNGYFRWHPGSDNYVSGLGAWFYKFENKDVLLKSNAFGAYADLSFSDIFKGDYFTFCKQDFRLGVDIEEEDFINKDSFFRLEFSSVSKICLEDFSSEAEIKTNYLTGKASGEVTALRINRESEIFFKNYGIWLAGDDSHLYASLPFSFLKEINKKIQLEIFNKPYGTVRRAIYYYETNPYLKPGEDFNGEKTPLNLGTAVNIFTFLPLRFEYAFRFRYHLPVYYSEASYSDSASPLFSVKTRDSWEHRISLNCNFAYKNTGIYGEFIYSYLRDKDGKELSYYSEITAKTALKWSYSSITSSLEFVFEDGRKDHLGNNADSIFRSNALINLQYRPDLGFYLKADNILNDDYKDYLYAPESELELSLGVKYYF